MREAIFGLMMFFIGVCVGLEYEIYLQNPFKGKWYERGD